MNTSVSGEWILISVAPLAVASSQRHGRRSSCPLLLDHSSDTTYLSWSPCIRSHRLLKFWLHFFLHTWWSFLPGTLPTHLLFKYGKELFHSDFNDELRWDDSVINGMMGYHIYQRSVDSHHCLPTFQRWDQWSDQQGASSCVSVRACQRFVPQPLHRWQALISCSRHSCYWPTITGRKDGFTQLEN